MTHMTMSSSKQFRTRQKQKTSRQTIRERIKQEVILFCQTTTIRGITRIVNARSKPFQSVWICSVILLFVGLLACMLFLARQYLEYHVIHPPQVLRDTPSPFPSMTFCNLRPLAANAPELLSKWKLKTPRQFARDVNNFAAQAYYYSGDTLSYQMITSAISMGGYLESLPADMGPQLGHRMNETLIHCMVHHTEGSKRIVNYCEQVGRWRRFVHAQYLNCYTYDLFHQYRDHVRNIELYVYLDVPANRTSCLDCFSAEIRSQLTGAMVVVHNADTYPDINQEGISIQPGSLMDIKVKTIKHMQKTPPYGRCSPDTPVTIDLYESDPYAYSEHACRMGTIQSQVNERCGCNAIEYPYRNASLPFCLSMSSFVFENGCIQLELPNSTVSSANGTSSTAKYNRTSEREQCFAEMEAVKSRVICKSEVTKHFQGDVVPSCTLPCTFFSYETDRSTSNWPTKSWQLSWLGTKAGKRLLHRPDLAEYHRARQLLTSPEGEVEAQAVLAKSDVLEKNLLAIMMIRPNLNLHNVEEKAVLSLTSFLSQSGGLLSIWIGLNMMSIIEVFELIVHLINSCKPSRRRGTLVPDEVEKQTNRAEASDETAADHTPNNDCCESDPALERNFEQTVPVHTRVDESVSPTNSFQRVNGLRRSPSAPPARSRAI